MHNSLTPIKQKRKRVGRGISAGGGKTAGRGTKGQKSRAGKKLHPSFEGGQTPLFQRFPKMKGFLNVNRKAYQTVNVSDLEEKHRDESVTHESLFEAGLIPKRNRLVKILGDGEMSKKFSIQVEAISKSALEKLEKAGGKFTSTVKKTAEEK